MTDVYVGGVELLWGTSIETSAQSRALEPDLLRKDADKISLIQRAVAHWSVVEARSCGKCNKPQQLVRALCYMYSTRKESLVPLVMATLRAYTNSLVKNLCQLPGVNKQVGQNLADKCNVMC